MTLDRTKNICIIGNIGSGKSTLSRLLGAGLKDSLAIPEDFDSNPFLPLYAADPPRWAFTNAVRYFYDYARAYQELTYARKPAYCFIDAGGATNRYVYGRYLAETGVMTAEENKFYELLCELLAQSLAYPEPDAYIFLRASPEACFARMKVRAWEYQTKHIPLDYLVAIERYLRAFQNETASKAMPFLELDSEATNFTKEEARAETIRVVGSWLQTVCG